MVELIEVIWDGGRAGGDVLVDGSMGKADDATLSMSCPENG